MPSWDLGKGPLDIVFGGIAFLGLHQKVFWNEKKV